MPRDLEYDQANQNLYEWVELNKRLYFNSVRDKAIVLVENLTR